MNEDEKIEHYPLKSLHDFLSELDKEWGKFRTASVIGIVSSAILVALLIPRLLGLLWRIRNLGIRLIEVLDEFAFLIIVATFISYEIYLLLRQYKFFAKWERRVGLLLHLEESLLDRNGD